MECSTVGLSDGLFRVIVFIGLLLATRLAIAGFSPMLSKLTRAAVVAGLRGIFLLSCLFVLTHYRRPSPA